MPRVVAGDYYTYDEAVAAVSKLNIKTFAEWCEYISPFVKKVTYTDPETGRQKTDKEKSIYKEPAELKDPRLPSDPRSFYSNHGNQWKGWGDFLGTGNIAPSSNKYVSYEEGIRVVHALGIRSKKDYRTVHKALNLTQLPRYPENYYFKKGIRFSWKEFLAPKFLPFEQAREYTRSLPNVLTYEDWIEYAKSGNRPPNIPAAPREVYREFWESWPDFLGSSNKPKSKPNLKLVK